MVVRAHTRVDYEGADRSRLQDLFACLNLHRGERAACDAQQRAVDTAIMADIKAKVCAGNEVRGLSRVVTWGTGEEVNDQYTTKSLIELTYCRFCSHCDVSFRVQEGALVALLPDGVSSSCACAAPVPRRQCDSH